MKQTTLLKTSITLAFLLIVGLCAFIFFELNAYKEALGSITLFKNSLMGIAVLSFIAYIIAWKLILDFTTNEANIDDKELEVQDIENNVTESDEDSEFEELRTQLTSTLENATGDDFFEDVIRSVSNVMNFGSALAFRSKNGDGQYEVAASWAFYRDEMPEAFKVGDGLHGQAAMEGRAFMIDELPESYFTILSGSGQSIPKSLYIIPVMHEGECLSVLEFASLHNGRTAVKDFLSSYSNTIVEHYKRNH